VILRRPITHRARVAIAAREGVAAGPGEEKQTTRGVVPRMA